MFNAQEELNSLSLSLLISILINLLFPLYSFSQTNETLTISTYYPSPYGVYNELRLYPKTTPTVCDSLTEGNMYYNSTTDQVMVCKDPSGWQSMSGLWTLNGTNLYPNNTTWNVGIGTTAPAAEKLDVAGNIHAVLIKSGNLTSVNNGLSGWDVIGEGLLGLGFSNGRSLIFGMDSSNNIGMGIRQGAIPYAVFSVSGADNSWNFRSWNNMSFSTTGLYPTPSIFVSGSTGNVGIGTTGPNEKLDVIGNIRLENGSTYTNLVPGSGNYNLDFVGSDSKTRLSMSWDHLNLYTNGAQRLGIDVNGNVGIGTTNPELSLTIGGFANGKQIFMGQDSVSGDTGFLISNSYASGRRGSWFASAGTGGISMASYNGGPIKFLTSSMEGVSISEMVRITNSGNVGIGTSIPGYTLTVNGNAWVTSGAWSGSDKRWKKDISPLKDSLNKIMNLQGVNFNWKTEEFPELKFSTAPQLGLIAQEVEKIVPEVVTTDNNGYKGLDYGRVSALLIEAIKELKAENDGLKARIKALESKPR